MTLTTTLLLPDIRELIEEKKFLELRTALKDLPPADVADVFSELEPDLAAIGFRLLPRDMAAEVFSYLEIEKQEELIGAMGAERAIRIIEEMSADDLAELLDELPADIAQRIIASLKPEDRKAALAILGYPEESVGRLMTPDYVRLRQGWTVAQALDHIRRHGRDAETINVVYVVDDEGRLVKDLRIRQLLLADPETRIDDIPTEHVTVLHADEDREQAVRMMNRYDRVALPVVDSRNVLLGIVTHDDVAEVAEEESTEDIQKLAGVEALDAPYMQTGLIEMVRKRGPWLAALFLGESVAVIVLSRFEKQLDAVIILGVLLPLIIASGGNSGNQTASLIIRALALQEVDHGAWKRILAREIVTGLTLGSMLGVMGVVLVYLGSIAGVVNSPAPGRVSFVVGTAVVGCVLWGTLLGAILPLVLKRLGFDPAVASAPLVATIMDASGMLIYFTIATLLLAGTLL